MTMENSVKQAGAGPIQVPATHNIDTALASTKARFTTLMAQFRTSITSAKAQARELAEIGITMFIEHGNLNYCQQLYDELEGTKGFLRPQAFLYWLSAHSKADIKSKKLFKNKERDVEDDLAGALAKPFWEFAPSEKPITEFDKTALLKALDGVITRFSNDERFVAKDDGEVALAAAKQAIHGLH